MVRLVAGVVVVISLGFLSQILLEEAGVLREVLVGETGPNLAYALIFLILWVIAGKKETTITKKRKNKLNLYKDIDWYYFSRTVLCLIERLRRSDPSQKSVSCLIIKRNEKKKILTILSFCLCQDILQ